MRNFALFLLSAVALLAGPGDKMKLTFIDDFNGDAIDENNWFVSGRRECVTVKGGKLSLSIKDLGTEGIQGAYLTSKFKQSQGYFEAAIRFNAYKGHRGKFSFGNSQQDGIPFGEVLWESLGDNSTNRLYLWARLGDEKGTREMRPDVKGNTLLPTGKLSSVFNRYGLLWTDKFYQFYLNDKPVAKIDKAEIKKPVTVRLSHSVHESDIPLLDKKTLPDNIDVDWVKVYSASPNAVAVQPGASASPAAPAAKK